MSSSLELILRFIWDLVVLVSAVALAWRGVISTEMVTAVIGLYAGLYGGAVGLRSRTESATKIPPSALTVGLVLVVFTVSSLLT